jgi:hypothetical protein
MSQSAVESLIDRWMNEPAFREALRHDPEGTVRGTGVELDADEWDALRAVDFSLSDAELQARVSRGGNG